MEPTTKPWYLSKTVIAGVLGALLTLAQMLGWTQATGIDKDSIAQNIVNVAEGILYLVTIVGRLTAKHDLTLTK